MRVGGARPLPFCYGYHHVQSCSVRPSWVGRYTYPCFISTNKCTLFCHYFRNFRLLSLQVYDIHYFNNRSHSTIIHSFILRNSPKPAFCCILFWDVFSSAEWLWIAFREYASIFVPRKRIPSYFLFRRMVQNGIPRVSSYFCSMDQNSEFFFSSAERFGTEFQELASIFFPRTGIPSFFLFRRRVRNEIPRICFYFCSTERNSE